MSSRSPDLERVDMADNTDTQAWPGEAAAVEAMFDRLLDTADVDAANYRAELRRRLDRFAAAVREQVAQEIEADAEGREQNGLYLIPWAMRDAARIARGVR